jgi:isoamylase
MGGGRGGSTFVCVWHVLFPLDFPTILFFWQFFFLLFLCHFFPFLFYPSSGDGTNDNFSWNCGTEGPTSSPEILALRSRQARNLHLALMLSQGTPMILSGDEFLSTRDGNNNWYGHDTKMTRLQWDESARGDEGWLRFYSEVIKFRRECPLLGRAEFLGAEDVTWHENRWDDPESRFLAYTLHDG